MCYYVRVMKTINTIKSNIYLTFYGYRSGEFLPIYSGSELVNRNQFIAYKAGKLAKVTGTILYHVVNGLLDSIVYVLERAFMQTA